MLADCLEDECRISLEDCADAHEMIFLRTRWYLGKRSPYREDGMLAFGFAIEKRLRSVGSTPEKVTLRTLKRASFPIGAG